ncbi:MAG: ABC transporter ATP-binding protein [Longimicrobiales bacterium]|nr:ABC transporter ATP-binding protein [Longimicrobiales bacterium]
MLRATGVGYGYGPAEEEAVEAAELEVAPGEVVAVLGPNGAGKSTLLRLLDGQLEPRRGTVRRPPPRTPDGLLAYGWAGEDAPHFEHLSGRENARFFARAAGLDRAAADTAVQTLLDRLALAPEAGRPVSAYSFGARRKLALVAALAHRPPVLLLDEPTVGLDADARAALARLLRKRSAAGAAVVLASHDTPFVEEVADRVVFMVRGRTRGGGRPRDLIRELGEGARIVVTLRAPPELPSDFHGPGWRVVEPGNPLVVRAEAGERALPDLCRALVSAGARIREISVRPPDLDEAFRRAVGETLPGRDGAGADEEEG